MLYESAKSKVLLDDDVCNDVITTGLAQHEPVYIPLTAAMTNLIWVVSVAQVKWV